MNNNQSRGSYVLTVNAGSSSIKLSVFDSATTQKYAEASLESIGQPSASLVTAAGRSPVAALAHADAADILIAWLQTQCKDTDITAVGHRIVHGGPHYFKSQLVTSNLRRDLSKLTAFDPEHLPAELTLVSTFQKLLPNARHIACFDTAFHHDLPAKARLLPIPRKLSEKGIRRYGFHGLSYDYIVDELRRVEGTAAANGKVIIAHLGSGASLAAVHGGQAVDTTMSMTPASGIPMSTRAGDLDPGLALYLAKTEGYDAEQFNQMVHHESGLLGISETTSDMKKLLDLQDSDARAKDAVDIFCYQVQKQIGSFAAALGGLHTLVFTGGMGENAPKIRQHICENLAFLGITLDDARNQVSERLISANGSPVGVHVIHTDEAVTIAKETIRLTQEH